MPDEHAEEPKPPETYVNRTQRELNDLHKAFRQSWKMGVVIVVVLGVFAAYELGLFPKKKDDPKDLSANIIKMAAQYEDLNAKYQRLQEESQKQKNAATDAEIAHLKEQLDSREQQLRRDTNRFDEVLASNPQAYGGVSTVPSQVLDAWKSCVESGGSTNASAQLRGIPVGAGASTSNQRCDAILRQGFSNISQTN